MNGARTSQNIDTTLLFGLERAFVPVARPNPVVVLWRWRYEAALLTGGSILGTAVIQAVGPVAAAAIAVGTTIVTVAAAAASRSVRRAVRARVWCVITAHRVRTGCAQAGLHSRDGKLPVVLVTQPAPWGETVLLWCLAGISAGHFAAARSTLAAACWAADVRVVHHPRHVHLVTLEVVRRPPASTHRTGRTATPDPRPRPSAALIPRPRQPAE